MVNQEYILTFYETLYSYVWGKLDYIGTQECVRYIRRLKKDRFMKQGFYPGPIGPINIANTVGNLIVKGIDYDLIKASYLARIIYLAGDLKDLITLDDIADYYWRFIQESRKIYKDKLRNYSDPDLYQVWVICYGIPWFFGNIREYIFDVVAVRKSTYEIWHNYQDDWTSYLQWPPEEVLKDVLALLPSFENVTELTSYVTI